MLTGHDCTAPCSPGASDLILHHPAMPVYPTIMYYIIYNHKPTVAIEMFIILIRMTYRLASVT